jgi:nucleotide-binding universal stress UspA family protein
MLDDARGYLADRGIEARTLAKIGDNAAHEILTAADDIGADVLVVARRRRPKAAVLGSTSSRIVHSAKCDVLVVHDGSPEPD